MLKHINYFVLHLPRFIYIEKFFFFWGKSLKNVINCYMKLSSKNNKIYRKPDQNLTFLGYFIIFTFH